MPSKYNLSCTNVNTYSCSRPNYESCSVLGVELKARIERARDHADLSQTELATKVHELTGMSCSQQAISRLETGQYEATAFLPAIATICGVRHEWLAFNQGPMLAGPDEIGTDRFSERFSRLPERHRATVMSVIDSLLESDRA